MNAIPGFFASMFGELLLDKDCDSIEADPNADPVEKEICRTFRQFNEGMRSFFFHPHVEFDDHPDGSSSSAESSDPQALKDSILQRPEQVEPEPPRRYSPFPRRPLQDKDLDKQVEADPSLLEKYLHGEESPRSHIHGGEESPGPHIHSHSSYSSVVITRRPDGSYEERRTVRDSEGNEEVTVTRSDGQQTHTEVHRTDKDGTTSKSEAEWERSRIVRQGDSDHYLNRLWDWFWSRKS